jgi:hypothetical protein
VVVTFSNGYYTYANIGIFPGRSVLGRVVGFAGPRLIGGEYTYVFILAQVAGAAMLLEDGTTEMLLEDGTTPMRLED